ncbi:MAG TPA: biotin transporter BioY, partial [Gemmatimonadales bacterium]|nr:biotin transporter BioY [Gemmatimonadales bacterium]
MVALSAQVVVPVSFSPVPMTLQPLAVLVVGGLLGAAGGVAALVTYLTLGILGLPVFAGGAAGGLHLVGPTGGYLLAFPLAA